MRRVLSLAVLLCLALVICSPAMAAEMEAGAEVSPKMVIVKMVIDLLWKAAIPLLFAWLAKKGYDKEVLRKAEDAVEEGVNDAYENFVRPLKKDTEEHPDGKLAEGERGDAKRWAVNKALEFAKGGPRRMLVRLGTRGIGRLVERIVARRKKRKQKDA